MILIYDFKIYYELHISDKLTNFDILLGQFHLSRYHLVRTNVDYIYNNVLFVLTCDTKILNIVRYILHGNR